ncbi:hypothetical protein HHK36_020652 [Tetracentron sinense]|uniref:Xylanase inhibitor N-terminal domain-containing protein n=1 Tax=Tetracentron sinense TaxID=13715 RepID=A0A835DBU0_TETSI|nr:hypothetical protein HHK36_020652 [Tetracentron sinense]
MASSPQFLLFSLLLISISLSHAKTSFRPHALVLPVSKDASTLQYLTHFNQRTPLLSISLVVDLGGQFLWVDCEQGYVSSSYLPAQCHSAQCSLARDSGWCNNTTCILLPDNPITSTGTDGELTQVSVSRLLFSCGSTFLLGGLASGVKGMAGLGRNPIGLPSQFAAAFSFHRKFAVCLSSSTTSNGVIFLGDGPYVMLPNVDVSQSLIYTPLFINPVSTAGAYLTGEPSVEYFIGVKSIVECVIAINRWRGLRRN